MDLSTKEFLIQIIEKIISSYDFRDRLCEINENFFNLKQEGHIRNSLLIHLNQYFSNQNLEFKALSEYPRINNKRVDLSIIDKNHPTQLFKIEFKFQFIGDYINKNLKQRTKEINYDFTVKDSDLFILLVIDWDETEKISFDTKHGLTKSLVAYNKKKPSDWKSNVNLIFSQIAESKQYPIIQIQVPTPYNTSYNFFRLSKNQGL